MLKSVFVATIIFKFTLLLKYLWFAAFLVLEMLLTGFCRCSFNDKKEMLLMAQI